MSENENVSFDKKTLAWFLMVALGGNIGVLSLNRATPEVRSDPFTGAEAEELKAEIYKHILYREKVHHINIPPLKTRERIRALERHAEKNDPDFNSPTQGWSD